MKKQHKNKTISDIEDHLGFWLRFVSNHVSSRFQKQLEAKDITVTEWVALRTFFQHDETSHPDLIDALSMTKGAASKVITRLEEKGLATRQAMDGKSRTQSIVLTQAGQQLVPQLAAIADANDAHFFAQLDPAEHAALLVTLKKLVQIHELKKIPVN